MNDRKNNRLFFERSKFRARPHEWVPSRFPLNLRSFRLGKQLAQLLHYSAFLSGCIQEYEESSHERRRASSPVTDGRSIRRHKFMNLNQTTKAKKLARTGSHHL
jgi:hypothetical protein